MNFGIQFPLNLGYSLVTNVWMNPHGLGGSTFGQEVLDHMEPKLGQGIQSHAGQGTSVGTVDMASTLMRAHQPYSCYDEGLSFCL